MRYTGEKNLIEFDLNRDEKKKWALRSYIIFGELR